MGTIPSYAQSTEDLLEILGSPEISPFEISLFQHADGSTWVSWDTVAGCTDQLEFSENDLEFWDPIGPEHYGYGHAVEVKIVDPPSGGGGGGATNPDIDLLDFVVSVFPNQKTLFSFSDGQNPVQVLLDFNWAGMIERPHYVRTFDNPDPDPDTRILLFFLSRDWDASLLQLTPGAQTLSNEATATVNELTSLEPQVLADLLLPPDPSTAGHGDDQAAAAGAGQGGFVRVRRSNADLDKDGIADFWEFGSQLGTGILNDLGILFDPFSGDSNGDGVADFVEAITAISEVLTLGGATGGGGSAPPPPLPYQPPSFGILPLGSPFRLTSASESFGKAWVTDGGVVAAIKHENGAKHLVWDASSPPGTGSNVDVLNEGPLPRATIIGVARAGWFLLRVEFEEDGVTKSEYRVVTQDNLDSVDGTAITAEIPESEIMETDYYMEKKTEAENIGEIIEETISQSVHSVYQISEWGNVVGSISVNFNILPEGAYEPVDGVMLLPYFWKTGLGLGASGIIDHFFEPDDDGNFMDEAGEPTFTYEYFGGLDTLVHSSAEEEAKIGWASASFEPTHYPLSGSYMPTDGNGLGITVGLPGTLQIRTMDDDYHNTGFSAAGSAAEAFTNNKFWYLTALNRPADEANGISAINGPAFAFYGRNATGDLDWLAWSLDELTGQSTEGGAALPWTLNKIRHVSNNGATLVEASSNTVPEDTELVLLLPFGLKFLQPEEQGDAPNGAAPFYDRYPTYEAVARDEASIWPNEHLQLHVVDLDQWHNALPQGFIDWHSTNNIQEVLEDGRAIDMAWPMSSGEDTAFVQPITIGGHYLRARVDVPEIFAVNEETASGMISLQHAITIAANDETFNEESVARYGDTGKADAIKHAALAAWIAHIVGEQDAVLLTKAHERTGYDNGFHAFTSTMDYYNNKVGIPEGVPYWGSGPGAAPTIPEWFDHFEPHYDNGVLAVWWEPDQSVMDSEGLLKSSDGSRK